MRTNINITLAFIALVWCACDNAPLPLKSSGTGTKDSTSTGAHAGTTTPAAKITYTCTMHPEVISDKPGKCPKCGMELVEKK